MKNLTVADKELVLSLSNGSEDAFRTLYLRYKDKLWHYCFSLLKSEDDADDMIQEVFIRIWELRNFMNPDLSFSSFIYTMTRNRVLNHFRKMDVELQVKNALARKLPVSEESAESALISAEYQQILLSAIDNLPPQQKRVFNLSRMENLSHKDIARQLNLSVYTVQEYISGALHFIKGYIMKYTDLTFSMILLCFLF